MYDIASTCFKIGNVSFIAELKRLQKSAKLAVKPEFTSREGFLSCPRFYRKF